MKVKMKEEEQIRTNRLTEKKALRAIYFVGLALAVMLTAVNGTGIGRAAQQAAALVMMGISMMMDICVSLGLRIYTILMRYDSIVIIMMKASTTITRTATITMSASMWMT